MNPFQGTTDLDASPFKSESQVNQATQQDGWNMSYSMGLHRLSKFICSSSPLWCLYFELHACHISGSYYWNLSSKDLLDFIYMKYKYIYKNIYAYFRKAFQIQKGFWLLSFLIKRFIRKITPLNGSTSVEESYWTCFTKFNPASWEWGQL